MLIDVVYQKNIVSLVGSPRISSKTPKGMGFDPAKVANTVVSL
jgi:hypothetical protein